jgi:hypothetical protein
MTTQMASWCPWCAAAASVEPRCVSAFERELGGHETKAVRIEPDRDDAPGRQRDPGAAAEGEVQRADEQGQRGGRERPLGDLPLRRGEAERQQRTERGQQAQSVPVSDRRREPVPAEDVGRELPREQPGGERVGADAGQGSEQPPDQERHRVALRKQQEGRHSGHVQKRPLYLADRPGRCRRPGERERDPHCQRAEQPEQRQLGGRQRNTGREGERKARCPGQRERTPVPGARKVSGLGGGQRGCHNTQADTGEHAPAFRRIHAVARLRRRRCSRRHRLP